MADESLEPEAPPEVAGPVEVGTITVSVWLGDEGTSATCVIEGLNECEAGGYLRPILAELEDSARGIVASAITYDGDPFFDDDDLDDTEDSCEP